MPSLGVIHSIVTPLGALLECQRSLGTIARWPAERFQTERLSFSSTVSSDSPAKMKRSSSPSPWYSQGGRPLKAATPPVHPWNEKFPIGLSGSRSRLDKVQLDHLGNGVVINVVHRHHWPPLSLRLGLSGNDSQPRPHHRRWVDPSGGPPAWPAEMALAATKISPVRSGRPTS